MLDGSGQIISKDRKPANEKSNLHYVNCSIQQMFCLLGRQNVLNSGRRVFVVDHTFPIILGPLSLLKSSSVAAVVTGTSQWIARECIIFLSLLPPLVLCLLYLSHVLLHRK